MDPYFFGPRRRPLFGVHHAPLGKTAEHGAVVCYPLGHEYVNALRGCRQLATRLSRAGIAVLRFDSFGCGDSAGAGEDARVEDWVADIAVAIEELRTRECLERVSLIGLRLGASLAAMVAASRVDVDSMVLWEPVVHGRAYVEALRMCHQAFLVSEAAEGRRLQRFSTADEIMGFPLPCDLADDLAQIDLLTLGGNVVNRVLLIGSNESAPLEAFGRLLAARGTQITLHSPLDQGIWVREVGQPRALVPSDTLEFVVRWMAQ